MGLDSGAIWEVLQVLRTKMSPISLLPQYGWVLITFILSVFVVHIFMAVRVGNARKKYGVSYPTMYADATNANANIFNCIQRGHQNSLEGFPVFLGSLLVAGVKYPVAASCFGLVWIAGRILYFQGYSTGNPKARLRGNWGHIGELGLLT